MPRDYWHNQPAVSLPTPADDVLREGRHCGGNSLSALRIKGATRTGRIPASSNMRKHEGFAKYVVRAVRIGIAWMLTAPLFRSTLSKSAVI